METRTTLSPHPQSVGAARRFVRDVLMSRRVSQPVVDTVELLTSEVMTNAIVHTGGARNRSPEDEGRPELIVRLSGGRVRIEVQDVSSAVPVRRFPDALTPSGRGMGIVDELARDWGVEHVPQGKRVWFEVPFTSSPMPTWARGRQA